MNSHCSTIFASKHFLAGQIGSSMIIDLWVQYVQKESSQNFSYILLVFDTISVTGDADGCAFIPNNDPVQDPNILSRRFTCKKQTTTQVTQKTLINHGLQVEVQLSSNAILAFILTVQHMPAVTLSGGQNASEVSRCDSKLFGCF
jgi:hypothetical protein